MRHSQRFREEGFSGLGIAGGTEPKFQSVASRIHGAIEVHPHCFDLHIGLIDAPGVIGRVELWSIVLNPAVDRGVIDLHSPFQHHAPPGRDS